MNTILGSAMGIFRKEQRLHGMYSLGTVIACFAVCATVFTLCRYHDSHIDPTFYLGVALYIALLYTLVTAATVYALEHEPNTFPFLRTLPISPLSVAFGKIGWVLCASALVLAGNLLCCTLFWYLQEQLPTVNAKEILLFFCPAIAEVFVWGIFWSTRCRSTAFAVFAAAACPILTFWLLVNFWERGLGEAELFTSTIPARLALIVLVALLAAWNAMRWFEFSVKDTRKVWIPRNFVFARYPQRVQPPFRALIHQHLRHASLVYPLGVICIILFSLACIIDCFWPLPELLGSRVLGIGFAVVPMGIVIFWGNIFGHDQRQESYKFLTRLGVHEGTVWWSRMLPAMLLYILVLLCILFRLLGSGYDFMWVVQFSFTVWLTIMAVGAFCSISCNKQMSGIGLTMCVSYLLVAWMMLFVEAFDSSPLWTTVPVALAFLAASRIRAGYWLREITTWRSRFISLFPVYTAILLVFIALPFVRIYSVPYVSQQTIDSYFVGIPDSEKEQLLQIYTERRAFARSVFSGEVLKGMNKESPLYAAYFCLRFMPWEEVRRERILRLQLIGAGADVWNCESSGAWDDVWAE